MEGNQKILKGLYYPPLQGILLISIALKPYPYIPLNNNSASLQWRQTTAVAVCESEVI